MQSVKKRYFNYGTKTKNLVILFASERLLEIYACLSLKKKFFRFDTYRKKHPQASNLIKSKIFKFVLATPKNLFEIF